MNILQSSFLIIGMFLSLNFLSAQDSIPSDFDFEYEWGYYGHYKVSTKESKVYIVVKHPRVYADTSIEITTREKQKIYAELHRMDFLSYTENYSPVAPIKPEIREFEIRENQTAKGTMTDTVWTVSPIPHKYDIHITSPSKTCKLTVFTSSETKSVTWLPNQRPYPNDFIDPRFDALLSLDILIRTIVEGKEAYKNLPESNAIYE